MTRRVVRTYSFCASEEFACMKDEVPPTIVDAHIKSVQSAVKKGETIDSNTFNIEKSGIAGTDKEGMYRSTYQRLHVKTTTRLSRN